MSCNFSTSCPIATKLCPGATDSRLSLDKSLSCSTEILPYYGPGAAMLLVIIGFGVPFLYYRLIYLSTKLVHSIPPESTFDVQGDAAVWFLQMQLSTNLCRALYYGFKYKWRYYSLLILFVKMLVVAVYVFLSSDASYLLVSCLYAICSAIQTVCYFFHH